MARLRIRRPVDFDFQPGDYVYVNVPSVARYEWHPFTVSSAPEDEGIRRLSIGICFSLSLSLSLSLSALFRFGVWTIRSKFPVLGNKKKR